MKYGIAAVLALVLSAAGLVVAEDAQKAPTTAPSTQPVNEYCAVMNKHKADSEVTIVHEGKTIAFCCKDCIETFNKNPDKYLKDMK